MTHSDLDPVIYSWAQKYGLHIYTSIRDDEIRAIDVVDDSGDTYQIGITPIGGEQQLVNVSIWDKRERSQSYKSSLPNLGSSLDDAYAQISEWIRGRGHTRTPIL